MASRGQFDWRTDPPGNRFVMKTRNTRRALLASIAVLAAIGALIALEQARLHPATGTPFASVVLQGGKLVGEVVPRGCWTGDLPVQRPYPIPRVPPPSKSLRAIVQSPGT